MEQIFNKLDKLADSFSKGIYYNKLRSITTDLDDKLSAYDYRKRVFIPLAIRAAFAKAAIYQFGYHGAFMADRVANALNLVKSNQASKGQKFKKCAVLPIKLAALGIMELSMVVAAPAVLILGGVYVVKGMIHYKQNQIERLEKYEHNK